MSAKAKPQPGSQPQSEVKGWRALGVVMGRIGRLKAYFLPFLPLAGVVALLVFFLSLIHI